MGGISVASMFRVKGLIIEDFHRQPSFPLTTVGGTNPIGVTPLRMLGGNGVLRQRATSRISSGGIRFHGCPAHVLSPVYGIYIYICLFEFFILETFKFKSGQVPNYGSPHSW